MWERKELKKSARILLNKNYWTAVLVSFVFAIVGGGGANFKANFNVINPLGSPTSSAVHKLNYGDTHITDKYSQESVDIEHPPLLEDNEDGFSAAELLLFFTVFGFIFSGVFIVVMVLAVFVFNPLQVGCTKYFINCIGGEGKAGNMGIAFEKNYKNIMVTMFLRGLYTFLWTLLFIIPGIIKYYEYMMIPYILADNPSIDRKEAFELSKKMMDGNKFDAFVMQLSFIGWNILSVFTLGILSIFYVNPYRNFSFAYLYDALRENKEEHKEEMLEKSPYDITVDLKKY